MNSVQDSQVARQKFGFDKKEVPKSSGTDHFELSKGNLIDCLYSLLLATGKIQGNEVITDININNKWLDDTFIVRIKTKKETMH